MSAAPLTHDEDARIGLLRALDLLDSPPEEAFDRLTRLASRLLGMPIALVSLVDRDRQWFKSRVGLPVAETPRDLSFCAHALHGRQPLIVPDARLDPRFQDNQLVVGPPGIRFYAGVPLASSDGVVLGTLCVIDVRPRTLASDELQTLQDLAAIAQREIAHREASRASHALSRRNDAVAQEGQARLHALFEQAAVGMAFVELDGRWQRVNRRLCQILGRDEAELQKLTYGDVTHPEDRSVDAGMAQRLLAGELDQASIEKRYRKPDGSVVWAKLSLTLVRDAQGRPAYFINVVEDIQARREAQAALHALRQELELRVAGRTRELQVANEQLTGALDQVRQAESVARASEAELRAVLENAQEVYIATNDQGHITEWNRQAELTFGWRREEALGRILHDTIIPAERRAVHAGMLQRYQRTGQAPFLNTPIELVGLRRDGRTFPAEVRISTLPQGSGQRFSVFLHDISARKQLEEDLAHQALMDPLTGLPNRRAVLAALARALARADRAGRGLAVLFLDLDGFKSVNDHHGHHAGDELLQQFARRLLGCVRQTDVVARLAGDEFVVILEALVAPEHDAAQVGAKIVEVASRPFVVDDATVTVGSSIGVSLHIPGTAATPDALLAQADAAMYQAKRQGKGRVAFAGDAAAAPAARAETAASLSR